MDIQELTEENASPLVLKVKSELLGISRTGQDFT